MSDQISQCDNLISKRRSVNTLRWWIFAFIVSLVVFSSALFFLGGEAHAKSGDGGGGGGEKSSSDSGGGGNGGKSDGGGSGGSGKIADGGGSAKGGGGDGPIGGLTSGGADSAKGSEGPRGDGGPSKDISSGDGQRSKDIVGDATSSSPKDAKDDAGPLDRTTSSDASDDISGRLDDSRLSGDTAKATSPSNITDKDLVTNDSNTAIQPVKQTAEETLQPVKQTAEETLQPVVAPASGATEPTAARTVAEPIGASEPVVAPATDTLTTGATESALEPVGPVLDSLPARGVDPLGSQQYLSSALVESPAYYQPAVTAALATEAASTSLDSDTVVAVVREGSLEGSTSNATANLSRSYLEQDGLSLLKEGLASLNLTGMQVALDQVPQPFPAGAMPMAVGGFSGGSSSSSSGGGLDAGILILLAVLLMGGKFLWSTRDFLKPNTALLLAIERPG